MSVRLLAVNWKTHNGVDTGGRHQWENPPPQTDPGAPVNPAVPTPPPGAGSDGAVKYETGSEAAHRYRRREGITHYHVRPPL